MRPVATGPTIGLRIALVAALALGGCTYISQAQYEAQLAQLDEDGDGSPHKVDCDDEDDRVNPDAVDEPYDGLDQDCNGRDQLDLDQDGFPGITREQYDALGSDLPYPPSFADQALDCDDTDDQIYPDPSHAIEVLYDAVDSDCQRDNDFDYDHDGFIPPTLTIEGVERDASEVLDEYLTRWGISTDEASEWAPPGHLLPVAGDCDDRDADVHPENTTAEVPYDGIDRDCDGANDFDADGDCFMPPLAAAQYDDYVAKYFGGTAPTFCVDPDLPFGDCVDADDPDLAAVMVAAGLVPAEIYPSTADHANVDSPYDAVDQDCGHDNDYDGDGDGFVTSQLELDAMNAYATLWGYEADVPGWVAGNPDAGITTPTIGDCDDTRFDTWPGALEVLGDGVDQDCAGDPDSARFGFGDDSGDFDWTNPTNPEVARLGDLFVVMVGAQSGAVPVTAQEFGIAIPFALADARGAALPDERTYPYWKSPFATLVMQPTLDIAIDPNPTDVDGDATPDPVVRTLSNSDSTVISYTYLNLNGVIWQTSSDLLLSSGGTNGVVPTLYATNALDMVIDGDDNPFALACASDRLDAVYSLAVPAIHHTVADATDGGDTCFFDAAPVKNGKSWEVTFQQCTAGSCVDRKLDQATSFYALGANTDHWIYGDQDEGWLALIDDTSHAWVGPVGVAPTAVLATHAVTHLDVAYDGAAAYVAAIVDDGGTPQVWLAFGDLATGLTEAPIAFDDPSVNGEVPTRVGIYADGDRVAVAVTATTGTPDDDSVGWVFLAPVP